MFRAVGQLVGLVVLSSAVAACAPEAPPPPPEVDVAALDPAVAELVQNALEEVRSRPHSAEPRLQLGRVLFANARLELAELSLEQAVALDPELAEGHYILALVRHDLGEISRALDSIGEALRLRADYAPGWARRAFWLLESGQNESVLEAAERALEAEPENRLARLARARAYLATGKAEAALEDLDWLASRDGAVDPYLQFLLGTANRQLGRREIASIQLSQGVGSQVSFRGSDPWADAMVGLQRGYWPTIRQIQGLLSTGRAEEALSLLDTLLPTYAGDIRVLSNTGIALAQLGRFEEALEVFDKAIAEHQGHHVLYLNLGQLQLRRGLLEEALEATEKAVEANPAFAAGHLQLGRMLSRLGRTDEAAEVLRSAVKVDPNIGAYWVELGRAEFESGDVEAALATFARALDLFPSLADAASWLGALHLRGGEFDVAQAAFERAQMIRPEDERVRAALKQIEQLRQRGAPNEDQVGNSGAAR